MTAPRRFSPADIVAGFSVALILIPQSLAYAEIAGLPPYIGLFAAAVPPIAAAFFASSPYLQTGPVAMTALLTFGALAPLATPETSEYIKLAALLAVVVGVVRVAFGLLRSGVIAYFMSQPVLVGFTSAAAILICSSQLPVALGAPAPDGGLLERAWWSITHPGDWETAAVVLAIVSVLVVIGGRRIHKLFPGVLVAVLIGVGFSDLVGYDGVTVGDIPAGLPPFGVDLPWGDLGMLIVPGIVIALVGFAEPAAIARVFAAQDRERWDPDREFISQGVANLASGFSGGFPVGGSFSRSSINKLAGGRSRWSGAVTGVVVLAFLPVAGILEPLPRAVLGAIVIAAVARLVRPDQVLGIFRFS
ncbi:MAG: sodium-independent anion transporter, partial [Acidimicrobiia bacterium]|nr:sodium-independent anion transporter [Acidimicrobiia bacterium]